MVLSLSFGTLAFGEEYEVVPGLIVQKGGVQRVGIDTEIETKDRTDSKSDPVAAPVGSLKFWTWLKGDAASLDYLKKPGILPLEQEVFVSKGMFGEKKIDVKIEGEEVMKRPDWRAGYLDLLGDEFKKKGYFITSEVSRYQPESGPRRYNIRFRTSDGRLLAFAPNQPIIISVVPKS